MYDTTLALFAAANGHDHDASRDMYDAIIRGLRHGPVGVMDELERIGLTPDMPWRHEEATDEVTALREELDELRKLSDAA